MEYDKADLRLVLENVTTLEVPNPNPSPSPHPPLRLKVSGSSLMIANNASHGGAIWLKGSVFRPKPGSLLIAECSADFGGALYYSGWPWVQDGGSAAW